RDPCRPEIRIAGQRHKGRVAAGAPSHYDGPLRVRASRIDQVEGARSRVVHVEDAPVSVEEVLILPSKSGAAAIIEYEVVPATSRQVLRLRVPGDRFVGRRTSVNEYDERAWLPGDRGGVENTPARGASGRLPRNHLGIGQRRSIDNTHTAGSPHRFTARIMV